MQATHERKIDGRLHISSGRIVQILLLYQFHNGEDDLGLRIEIIAIVNCVSTVITSIWMIQQTIPIAEQIIVMLFFSESV